MVAYISLADTRRGVLPTEGLALDSPSAHVPYGYTGSVEEGCEPDGPCDVLTGPGAADFRFEEPVGSPQPAKIYLVILGEQQQVELVESPGWRLIRTRLRATIVRANSATGVVVADERAEHFAEASGTGGAHGSLAVGTPPCRLAHRTGYVREGYGSATLTGGQRPASFSCGGVPAAFDPVAYAQTRTRWRLAGSVTGDAMGPTRLTIINL